jgi:hypothetical protein
MGESSGDHAFPPCSECLTRVDAVDGPFPPTPAGQHSRLTIARVLHHAHAFRIANGREPTPEELPGWVGGQFPKRPVQ